RIGGGCAKHQISGSSFGIPNRQGNRPQGTVLRNALVRHGCDGGRIIYRAHKKIKAGAGTATATVGSGHGDNCHSTLISCRGDGDGAISPASSENNIRVWYQALVRGGSGHGEAHCCCLHIANGEGDWAGGSI